MSVADALSPRLEPGAPAPDLAVQLAGGGVWRLSDQSPEHFTLVVVFRGWHCSFCKPEIDRLAALQDDFSSIGISLLAVSMDDGGRAEKASREWDIDGLPLAYGMSEGQARAWGLLLSRRIKPQEPEIFSEPGAFLVRVDGTVYAQFQSTAPWLRLDLDVLYRGVQLAMQRGTPPRGAG